MALKKDSNSLDSEQEKSQNENFSLLELNNLENKKEIESKPLEVSKGNDNENGFLDFGFNQSILNSIRNKGYKNPTPIQKAAIPELMLGRDLLGQAQTGTGKTAAFALPLIEKLADNKGFENIFCRDNFERRLLYTAITRAKKFLDIYYLN